MPWNSGDAKKHKKGLSSAQSRKWSKIANAVLSDSGDEGKAIRIANSKTESRAVFDALEEDLGDSGYESNPSIRKPKVGGPAYKISIEAKKLGTFSNLGNAIEKLVRVGKDFKLPLRWDSDTEFMSGAGMVTIVYIGPHGEEPLGDEEKKDIEYLIASELDLETVDLERDENEW